jgi:hypothetical protein
LRRATLRWRISSRSARHSLQGLLGRTFKPDSAAPIYTDTESIFLAPVAALFQYCDDNFRRFKACAVTLWAQSYYHIWNVAWDEALASFPDPQCALSALQA